MLYLKDKREVRLFEIIGMKEIKVERILKIILEEYDDVISRRIHNIENCRIIKYAIRFLDKTSIVDK